MVSSLLLIQTVENRGTYSSHPGQVTSGWSDSEVGLRISRQRQADEKLSGRQGQTGRVINWQAESDSRVRIRQMKNRQESHCRMLSNNLAENWGRQVDYKASTHVGPTPLITVSQRDTKPRAKHRSHKCLHMDSQHPTGNSETTGSSVDCCRAQQRS